MKKELFEELLQSVREAGEVLRGEREPSRQFEISEPDVKRIRAKYNLAQHEFARRLGLSVRNVQNWEQGLRVPTGPARVLLRVVDKHPEAVWDVVEAGEELVETKVKARR